MGTTSSRHAIMFVESKKELKDSNVRVYGYRLVSRRIQEGIESLCSPFKLFSEQLK